MVLQAMPKSDLPGTGLQPTYLVEREIDSATPAGGAVPASADGAPEAVGFGEFWRAYPAGKRVSAQKPKARAAWEKLAPDAGLRALIVAKAEELAEHHTRHGTELRWIKTPANWLSEAGWEDDLPAVYAKSKAEAGTPKPKAEAVATKPKPSKASNDNRAAERQWRQLTINGATVDKHDKGSVLVLALLADDGTTITEKIICEDASEDVQRIGQKQLGRLQTAIGIEDLDDERQLLGLSFLRRLIEGKVKYRAIAAAAA